MDTVVSLYFGKSEISDDIRQLIDSWVKFFQKNWDELFYVDKDVILRLEFFLDNKKIIKNHAPPNNEVYLYELQKNPGVVLKFMKASLHLLLFHLLDLKEDNPLRGETLGSNNSIEKETFGALMRAKRKEKKKKTCLWSSLFEDNENKTCNYGVTNHLINELKHDKYKNCETFRNYFMSTKITIYLYNWHKTDKFENVTSEKVNQLICLRGCVLRVSPVKLLISNIDFVCETCKRIVNVEFVDGKYDTPKKCINVDCDSRVFSPLRESARSIEYQKILLKEDEKVVSTMYEVNDWNSHNLTVTLEVSKFFVNSIFPGNHVEALGILKVISLHTNHLVNGKNALFNMFVDCLSVFPISSKKYLNNNYFNLVKIKETKNKLYSSFLWESYIDKFQKKLTLSIRKRGGAAQHVEDTVLGKNFSGTNELESENATKDLYKSGVSYANHPLSVSVNTDGGNTEQHTKSDCFSIDENFKRRKMDELNNTKKEGNMWSNFSGCMFGEYVSQDIELGGKNVLKSTDIKKRYKEGHVKKASDLNNEDYFYEDENVEEAEKDLFKGNDEFDSKSLDFIQEVYSNEKNKFYLLVASFCPRIMMSSYIKAGILLSLLGGKTLHDEFNEIKRRGNIHCLLIGDPGIGKSRILRYVNNIIDKSIFICSTSTSINGLTACAVKDSVNNEYALEAGALVLSDKGVCCIDELDKISLNEQQSFLECMENQSINITKAGIVCNLKARCTIVAASNPKEGKYNFKKSIFDNIKISFPLLSRFDLVFLLTDQISEEKDKRITDILIKSDVPTGDDSFFHNLPADTKNPFAKNECIIQKCKNITEENYLPLELIGVFIKYSRKYISPVLSEEAKEYVKQFYIHLRNLSLTHSDISIPITIRQLESLIRLCQGRARADLSKIVTKQHVQEVVEIYQKTIFYPLFLKSLNFKNPKNKAGPRGKSAAALSRPFKQQIIKLAKQTSNRIANKDLRNMAQSIIMAANSDISDEALVHIVNNEGFILYKGSFWEVDPFYLK